MKDTKDDEREDLEQIKKQWNDVRNGKNVKSVHAHIPVARYDVGVANAYNKPLLNGKPRIELAVQVVGAAKPDNADAVGTIIYDAINFATKHAIAQAMALADAVGVQPDFDRISDWAPSLVGTFFSVNMMDRTIARKTISALGNYIFKPVGTYDRSILKMITGPSPHETSPNDEEQPEEAVPCIDNVATTVTKSRPQRMKTSEAAGSFTYYYDTDEKQARILKAAKDAGFRSPAEWFNEFACPGEFYAFDTARSRKVVILDKPDKTK